MAAPTDRVKLLKSETPGDGGTEDDVGFPTELDPGEDAASLQGFFLQPPGGPEDELVYVTRDGSGNIVFLDVATGSEVNLLTLRNAIKGRIVNDAGLADANFLTYDAGTNTWVPGALGSTPTFANIQQLALSVENFGVPTSWVKVKSFIYGGSVMWGSIDQILALTSQSNIAGGRAHDIRVFDVTNGNVIASVTGLSFAVPTVSSLGAVGNVPTTQSIFEVQVRRSGGAFNIDFPAISLRGTS